VIGLPFSAIKRSRMRNQEFTMVQHTLAIRQHNPRQIKPFSRRYCSLLRTAGTMSSLKTPSRVEFSSKVWNKNLSELEQEQEQQQQQQRTPLTRSSIPIQRERHRMSIASRRDCSSAVTAIPDPFLRAPDVLPTLWSPSSPIIWNTASIRSHWETREGRYLRPPRRQVPQCPATRG